ncbi:MAG TPA: hypothetical protein VHG10_05390 [Glycomyces sp.]|nr:hypothetical protein [Glycomyces sp.]
MLSTDADAETDQQRSDLEDRVFTLESIAIRALAAATVGLLTLGSALPVYADLEKDAIPTLRLLTAPFAAFGALDEVEDARGFTVTMGIVFAALLAGIVAAIGIGLAQWNRREGAGMVRSAKVVAWVLLIGMLVPLLITITAMDADRAGDPGPAMWCFVPGVILFATTVFSRGLRRLWCVEA